MRRKLFKAFSLLSLLLAAATILWWKSSENRIDQLAFEPNASETDCLWGSGGKIMLTRTVHPPVASTEGHSGQLRWAFNPRATSSNNSEAQSAANPILLAASFTYASQPLPQKSGGGMETTVVVPAWLVTAFFSLLPMMWVASKLKRKGGGKKPAAS